ncbi:hypothetical protein GOBAR_DD04021 [Gossypium barbadense]|nr:hypothetical protein GOBAR_DD04021 [Gossypium barbadense]
MGNNDEGKSKSDKSSSPVPTDQANIHVYPDWAAMQAYYGGDGKTEAKSNAVAVAEVTTTISPKPIGTVLSPGMTNYMWGPPQPMMPPYGAPYATIYSHGGVYAHPAVPITAAPVEAPTKSSGNTERGSTKKMKGFDGLAMSIGNGTAENDEGAAEPRLSQSVETEGSTDGSDGNTTGLFYWTGTLEMIKTALELRNPSSMNAKSSPTNVPCGVMPPEVWMQNERELKRERRKQSNRESARRSRLRKQAETEELARKVESLTAENATLRSEINQLTEKSEKLRLENATLVEGLKNAQLGHTQENITNKNEDKEGEMYEKKSGAKLHQLLDASPRTDAVAAS